VGDDQCRRLDGNEVWKRSFDVINSSPRKVEGRQVQRGYVGERQQLLMKGGPLWKEAVRVATSCQ
jgi:hypothetical protein